MATSAPQTILDNFSSLIRESHPPPISIPQSLSHPPPISIPQSLLLKNEDLACYLIFKIFTHKLLRLQELKQSLAAAWNCRRSPPRISEYHGDNVFLAKFDKKSDTHQIVEGAPWLLDGDLVSVQRCRPSTLPSAYPFHVSPFWVQFHGLPIDFLTAEVAVLLGNQLGSVSASPSLLEQLFIRVRVEIDVCKPLVGSLLVSLPTSEAITVQIMYENLPTYCRFCGMIGHDGEADQCRSREDLEAAIVDGSLPDESRALIRSRLTQSKYEHSLRAIPFCLPKITEATEEDTEEIQAPAPVNQVTRDERNLPDESRALLRARLTQPKCEHSLQALPFCLPKITEITEEDTADIQASAPVNQVKRDERGKRSPESSDIEEVHGAQIVSLFRKMLPSIRPSVDDDDITLNQNVQIKFILKLLIEDPKKRSKALKTTFRLPGVSSPTIKADRPDWPVMKGVNADGIARTLTLRKRLGYVAPVNQVRRDECGDLSPESSNIEVVHGAQIVSLFRKMLPCVRPSVVDDDVTLNQNVQIKFILKLLMEDPKKRSKAPKTAITWKGVLSATIKEDRPDWLVMEGVNADGVALTFTLRKRLGYVEIVSVSMRDDNQRAPLFVDIRQYAEFVRWRPDDHGS